jgi:hypothetical protein
MYIFYSYIPVEICCQILMNFTKGVKIILFWWKVLQFYVKKNPNFLPHFWQTSCGWTCFHLQGITQFVLNKASDHLKRRGHGLLENMELTVNLVSQFLSRESLFEKISHQLSRVSWASRKEESVNLAYKNICFFSKKYRYQDYTGREK